MPYLTRYSFLILIIFIILSLTILIPTTDVFASSKFDVVGSIDKGLIKPFYNWYKEHPFLIILAMAALAFTGEITLTARPLKWIIFDSLAIATFFYFAILWTF